MITLINYSSEHFREAAKLQAMSFINMGGKHIRSYSYEDLEETFRKKHHTTLSKPRGSGYWIWKPEIIQISLEGAGDTDLLLYLDAGILQKDTLDGIIRNCSKTKISIWESSSENEPLSKWCHPLVAQKLSLSENFLSKKLLMAGALLIPKNDLNQKIISKWGELCSKPYLLYPDLNSANVKDENYLWHRHDSTLLSILAYQNLESFDIKSFTDFELAFILHRKPKPYFTLLQPTLFYHKRVRNFLRKFLPRKIYKVFVILKFLKVARMKNLTKLEIKSHLKEIKKT